MYKNECAKPFEMQMSSPLLMQKMFGKMSWYFMMNIETEYYFLMSCFFWWFYTFWIFCHDYLFLYGPFLWIGFNCLKARATSRRHASSFRSIHIYQLLFYSQGFSYYMCAYNGIFPFKFKIQTKILSLALIHRWLTKFSFKVINEKRRVIIIYIFLLHNKFYLFKYNTCNTWGTCVIIWLKRFRGILRQIKKKKNTGK